MGMIRSTTPTIVLKIKDQAFDMTSIDICHVTIENDSGRNKKTFIVDSERIDAESKTISVDLTWEDTEAFEEGVIDIQLKIKLTNNRVIASKIVNTTMDRILEEGKMEEGEIDDGEN